MILQETFFMDILLCKGFRIFVANQVILFFKYRIVKILKIAHFYFILFISLHINTRKFLLHILHLLHLFFCFSYYSLSTN